MFPSISGTANFMSPDAGLQVVRSLVAIRKFYTLRDANTRIDNKCANRVKSAEGEGAAKSRRAERILCKTAARYFAWRLLVSPRM